MLRVGDYRLGSSMPLPPPLSCVVVGVTLSSVQEDIPMVVTRAKRVIVKNFFMCF